MYPAGNPTGRQLPGVLLHTVIAQRIPNFRYNAATDMDLLFIFILAELQLYNIQYVLSLSIVIHCELYHHDYKLNIYHP